MAKGRRSGYAALASYTLVFSARPVRSPSLGHKWLGLHGRAGAKSLLPLCDDTFTWLQSVLDNPLRPNPVANLDRPDGDLVVPADNINLIAALQLGDSSLGNQ